MKKILLCLCCLCVAGLLFAQDIEEPPETPPDSNDIEVFSFKPVRAGDKYIKMGIGLGVPLFNTGGGQFAHKTNMYPGPKIFGGLHFYVTDGLSLGADLSLEFYPTLGKNLYFCVPVSFAVTYTPTYKRWRFPMGMDIGSIFMSYLGNKTAGLYINPFFSFYYQYSPEWSFGGELNWDMTTEFRKNRHYQRIQNKVGISFSVRYHY